MCKIEFVAALSVDPIIAKFSFTLCCTLKLIICIASSFGIYQELNVNVIRNLALSFQKSVNVYVVFKLIIHQFINTLSERKDELEGTN